MSIMSFTFHIAPNLNAGLWYFVKFQKAMVCKRGLRQITSIKITRQFSHTKLRTDQINSLVVKT